MRHKLTWQIASLHWEITITKAKIKTRRAEEVGSMKEDMHRAQSGGVEQKDGVVVQTGVRMEWGGMVRPQQLKLGKR